MLHIVDNERRADAQDTQPMDFVPSWYAEARAARECGACTPMCHVTDPDDRPDSGMEGLAGMLLWLAGSAALVGIAAFVALF